MGAQPPTTALWQLPLKVRMQGHGHLCPELSESVAGPPSFLPASEKPLLQLVEWNEGVRLSLAYLQPGGQKGSRVKAEQGSHLRLQGNRGMCVCMRERECV